MKNYLPQKGQTLLEIVIALAIIVLLLMGVIVATTHSLKSARFSRSKSISVSLAQEGMEILRTIRDQNWTTFAAYGSVASQSWCMDKVGTLTSASGACPFAIDALYNRQVTLTWQDPKMKVLTLVTWNDGGQNYQTSLTTYFTQWK